MSAKRHWALLLAEVTRRNVGRPTRLELNDPELGAQVVEEEYPLRGVAYDSRDDRIEMMLGETGATDRRLTQTIAQLEGVELLRADGADRALCIQHQGMRTLLFIRPSCAKLPAFGRAGGRAGAVG